MNTILRSLVAVLLIILTARASAGETVPALPTLLGFETGRSSLSEVEDKLGVATVPVEPGSASSFPTLCYRAAAQGDRTALTFQASATFSSPGDLVLVTLSANQPSDSNGSLPSFQAAQCSRTKQVKRGLRLSNGLSLGLRTAEVERLLGTPTSREDRKLNYKTSYRREITDEDRMKLVKMEGAEQANRQRVFIDSANVVVGISNGRVESITVARIEEPSPE